LETGSAAGAASHGDVMNHHGQCHCGAVTFRFETEQPLAPRACQCGFCRRHGARTLSDPAGAAEITLGEAALWYRFASRAADYLLCGRCGTYVGAVAQIDGSTYATLNLNAFDDPRPDLAAEPVSYDGESAEEKAERRHRRWTPARLF
jgi:hypothetical protein